MTTATDFQIRVGSMIEYLGWPWADKLPDGTPAPIRPRGVVLAMADEFAVVRWLAPHPRVGRAGVASESRVRLEQCRVVAGSRDDGGRA